VQANDDQAAITAFAVWITGLPASGKSTLTAELVRQLSEAGINAAVLESDALRKVFSSESSYGDQEREYFYSSLCFIGRVLTEHGICVVFDATANLRSFRARARQQIPRFIEIFVECPLETCIDRDPKGIYRKAREGQTTNVPGLQTLYEPPLEPDIVVRGDEENPEEAARRIIDLLVRKGFITAGTSPQSWPKTGH
jgi:adenylylsulfate kinase